jgi:methyltransferase (TIGR00027 family)
VPQQNVRNTALGAATCRLIEQYEPEGIRLVDDLVVRDLVGTLIRGLMRFARMRNYTIRRTDAIMPGIYGLQICRACYIDDAVEMALSRGIEQLVILGAGFDTRPYRLAGMEKIKVVEIDLPSVQEEKKKKLQKHFGRLPQNVSFVSIDFETQSLGDALAGTAFDPSKSVIFVWEGVTQYISEEAVRRTLTDVGNSAPGSTLIFTYVLNSVVERRSGIPGADRLMDVVAKNNAPWLFGLEPSDVPSFLKPFHLTLVADVGNTDYQASYLEPRGRKLVVSECERVVQAIVVRP